MDLPTRTDGQHLTPLRTPGGNPRPTAVARLARLAGLTPRELVQGWTQALDAWSQTPPLP